jgi:site-specific DNA-cytosine methylase
MSFHPHKRPNRILNILGVSAGNGVMLYPFKDHVIANIECRSDYYIKGQALQWNTNFDVPMYKTLKEFKKPIDVILGHPKCGLSSMFALSRGKKFSSHQDEPSLTLFIEAVHKYRPKIFVMENLPKLLDSFEDSDLKSTFQEYNISYIKGPVSMFGNSQLTRKRLIVIGLRNDYYTNKRKKTIKRIPLNKTEPHKTKTLLMNLPDNGNITEPLTDIITMYAGYKVSLDDAQDFWLSNPNLRHWPVNNGRMSTAPGVYINHETDYPLTVRKTNRQFNPDGIQMSPRELARIQGICDGFLIYHDKDPKVTINKGRITVANTPPMNLSFWLLGRFQMLKLL